LLLKRGPSAFDALIFYPEKYAMFFVPKRAGPLSGVFLYWDIFRLVFIAREALVFSLFSKFF
jgi:hypothetical protein